jgi:gliding motility-associated-like protein
LKGLSYYRLTIDLASRDDLGHFTWEEGFVAYRAPVILKVYGSPNGMSKGPLLCESKPVTSTEWIRHSLILYTQETWNYLVLEVGPADLSEGSGNLVLDGIHLEEMDEPPLEFGELKVPNVFTPNGDGANDQFAIRGLPEMSHLIIYDRLGRIVFESMDYEQDWDGTDRKGRVLPPDTYWYHLILSETNESVKGLVYLKRE